MPRPPALRSVSTLPIDWTFNDEHATSPELTIGLRLQFSEPGAITGVRFLQSVNDAGFHGAALYGPDFALQRIAAFLPSEIAGGEVTWSWALRQLRPVWPVEANTLYVFSVSFAQVYYASSAGFLSASDVSVGPVTIRQNDFDGFSGNGVFQYGPFSIEPSNSLHNGTIYGIEPLFQPE